MNVESTIGETVTKVAMARKAAAWSFILESAIFVYGCSEMVSMEL